MILTDKDRSPANVAFSARMTEDVFVMDGIIPFDVVIANSGNHYNSDTYKFVCPHASHYYFSFSIYGWSKFFSQIITL